MLEAGGRVLAATLWEGLGSTALFETILTNMLTIPVNLKLSPEKIAVTTRLALALLTLSPEYDDCSTPLILYFTRDKGVSGCDWFQI